LIFGNVLVLKKMYEICVTRGHDFSKPTYPAVRISSHFSTIAILNFAWSISKPTCQQVQMEILVEN